PRTGCVSPPPQPVRSRARAGAAISWERLMKSPLLSSGAPVPGAGGSEIEADGQAVVAARQGGQGLEVEPDGQGPDAAVGEHDLAAAGVGAAETGVGQGAVLVLGRPQGARVPGRADAGHAPDGVVLPAEDAAVLVLAAQRVGADVLLPEHQGVGGAVGDA